MEYWVTNSIAGVYGEDAGEGIKSLEEARAERDRLNSIDKEEGGTGEFWILVDENGEEID